MKLFSTQLRRKRGVILFVTAFMLPLFFVVVVGIDTFSKRQETTRNLLESNLWLSGRSALDQVEAQFVELESKKLNDEYFSSLLKNDSLKQTNTISGLFIIDHNFQVVYPETIEDKADYLFTYKKGWNSGFREYMSRGENAELTLKNYTEAIKNYQTGFRLAKTPQQEALAIEGMARAQLAGKNYKQAILNYQLLKNKYSQVENSGGHPYGITAPLQLYALSKSLGDEVFSQDSMLITYQMIKDRHWMISSSSYFFFKAEYEFTLKIDIDSTDSRFEQLLEFNQFIIGFIIPAIKERSGFSEFNKADETKRTSIHAENKKHLVSFKELLTPDSDKKHFIGISWNPDSIITYVISPKLTDMSKETGLEFRLVNEDDNDLITGITEPIPEESLTLSFSNIPFPWSLVAIQPGYKKLESDAKTQVIIYGLLVVLIIILMLFAVYVLLRDISRETDSMLLQTEFVHNVSHELKTPLSLIRLYGETLLIKDKLPESDRKEGLQIITKESERLSYMINNILDFSKIEMGRKEFDLKPGNLTKVVTDTLASYRYHFIKKGFDIEEEIDQNIPMVLFDKNAVEGILINLFSNAIKFSNDKKEMTVRLKQKPETIFLEITDKGIGIPQKELSNIFNRFYRVKSTSDFEARGSGLGLTLVKHAVATHGWQIDVKSTPGLGSSFSILIPLKTLKEEKI